MRRFRWDSALAGVVLCIGIGAVCYAILGNDEAVFVNTVPSDETVLVLDAGHGGIDGGCSSADKVPEKGINLNIMLSVRDMANIFGYETVTTRETDTSIHDSGITGIRAQKISDMENRLEIFNSRPNSVCVSIHQNTYTDPKFCGAQMFYSQTNPESETFARILQGLFRENVQPYNDRETKLCGNELYLCHFCRYPAVMAECGFLSNPEEAEKLKNEEYQKKIAFTVFEGFYKFDESRK